MYHETVDPRLLNSTCRHHARRSPGGALYGGNTSASLFDIEMSQISKGMWIVHTDKDKSELRATDRGHIGHVAKQTQIHQVRYVTRTASEH